MSQLGIDISGDTIQTSAAQFSNNASLSVFGIDEGSITVGDTTLNLAGKTIQNVLDTFNQLDEKKLNRDFSHCLPSNTQIKMHTYFKCTHIFQMLQQCRI